MRVHCCNALPLLSAAAALKNAEHTHTHTQVQWEHTAAELRTPMALKANSVSDSLAKCSAGEIH